MNIQPLSPALVHRIAAGEVIDSPAAVVRELIENALDAGASRIGVALWANQGRIQVSDNGSGFSWADLQWAAAPHATSKLRSSEDLLGLQTLGFRGEALHSLTQVAQLQICSRVAQTDNGWRADYDLLGQVKAIEPAAIAVGTVVTVDKLFANWPERQQALPPLARQMRAIQAVVHEHALCHPQVTWQVTRKGVSWFSLSPGESALAILPQVQATIQPADLRRLQMPLSFPLANCALDLLVGLPDRCHRYRPDWIRIAVNGRCVQVSCDEGGGNPQLRPLEQTILTAFRQMLPRHRYPVCFAHLQVDPALVDWNRHPAKTLIYLHHLDLWRQHIAAAIQEALQLAECVGDRHHGQQVRQLIKMAEREGHYALSSSLPQTEENDLATADRDLAESEVKGLFLKAVAQLHQTYILAEHEAGFWLVEQHIAHERVLYEQLSRHWEVVPLSAPVILSQLTVRQVEQLQRLNFEVDTFGPQQWAIRSAPVCLSQREDCAAALHELSQGDGLQAAIVATACRSAIRNGTLLSLQQMQTLLDQWQRTHNPRTCPHGRPIYLPLEESQLARFFRRHWVIGKSHGI